MPDTIWVTPSLMLGRPPQFSTSTVVTSASEAIRAIDKGLVAVLPADAWQAARQVLEAQGLTPDEVEDRLRFARGEGRVTTR